MPAKKAIGIVPAPQEFKSGRGVMKLGQNILAEQSELRSLAGLVSREIDSFSSRKLNVVQGVKAAKGDIVLELTNELGAEEYTLEVGQTALIRGGSYQAVAYGTVTLMQTLYFLPYDNVHIPRMTVRDFPKMNYRGLHIDLARQFHPLKTVKQLIELCRWYKVKYIHLHFTDCPLFTFPSDAYPELASKDEHYTKEELIELESFSQERGVTIIPEFDIPGHTSLTLRADPRFGCSHDQNRYALCPSRPETMRFIETIIGEMIAIFRASPYFHIGADEVDMKIWEGCDFCKAHREKHNLENVEELYRDFIIRSNEIVKKHGRQTIVWEGFSPGGKLKIPHDIIVMEFESLYNPPENLLKDGYTMINAAWRPLYVVGKINFSLEEIYKWNYNFWNNWVPYSRAYPNGIQLPENNQVIGGELCSWGQSAELEMPSLKLRLAAMSERVWNPDSKRSFREFSTIIPEIDDRMNILALQAAGDSICREADAQGRMD